MNMSRRYFLKLVGAGTVLATAPALGRWDIPATVELKNGVLTYYCYVPDDAGEVVFDVGAAQCNGHIRKVVVFDRATDSVWAQTKDNGISLSKHESFSLQVTMKRDQPTTLNFVGS